MKRVKWLAGERILPMNGEVSTGEEKDLPNEVADGYVASGEAEFVSQVEEVKPQKRERVRTGDES